MRWVLWAYAGFSACVLALTAAPPIAAVTGHDIRLDPSGNLTTTGRLPGWLDWFTTIVTIAGVAGILLLGVRRQVRNWRQAGGERRQQLKWVAFGGAVSVVWLAGTPVVGDFFFAGLAALPVSIGIAILKYRLYDIDRIISRTLAYAIITGLLVGLYAGLVLLATEVLRFHSTVAVAASTLAAALFNPLRRRVQRRVDRRFDRARYDADQTVAAFAARLKDAVELDSVRDDLSAVVHQALEPAHTSVWVRADERHSHGTREEGDGRRGRRLPAAPARAALRCNDARRPAAVARRATRGPPRQSGGADAGHAAPRRYRA